MKKLILFLILLPVFAIAQDNSELKERFSRWREGGVILPDTIIPDSMNTIFRNPNYYADPGFIRPMPNFRLPAQPYMDQSITVRIYVDDDEPVQTLIDALRKAGIVVERTEWNYEKKYSEYIIKKPRIWN